MSGSATGQLSASTPELLPLEELFLVGDSAELPMTVSVPIVFRGPMDEAQWRRAFSLTVAAHPLLHSLPVRRWGRWRWQPMAEDRWAPCYWCASPEEAAAVPPSNLATDGPIRIVATATEATTRMVIEFYHLALDGLGFKGVLDSILRTYDRLSRGEEPEVPVAADFGKRQAALPYRGVGQAMGIVWRHRGVAREYGMRSIWQWGPPSHSVAAPCVGQVADGWDRDLTEQFRRHSRRVKVSENSLLAAGILRVLVEQQADPADREKWLRLCVPINRRSDRATIGAWNAFSVGFLDRRAADCDDFHGLAGGIGDEIELLQRDSVGSLFLSTLKLAQLVPGLLQDSTVAAHNGTVLFTSVGRMFDYVNLPRDEDRHVCVGDAIMASIQGFAPVAFGGSVSILALWYARRLTLHGRCDRRVISEARMGELLRRIREIVVGEIGMPSAVS